MSDTSATPVTTFDLKVEAAALRDSELYSERGQNSRTLLKNDDLRLVMIALKSGHQIKQHKTEFRLNLNAVEGHVQLTVEGELIDLPAGNVLVLDPTVPHDVTALEDSVILLSLSGVA